MSDYYDSNLQYPQIYKIIDPEIDNCIDCHYKDRPEAYMPDQQEFDNMVQEVYRGVVKKYPEYKQDPKQLYGNNPNRRRPYGGNKGINDLIWYILLERLLRKKRRKRRKPYPPYPTPYPRPYPRPYPTPYDDYDRNRRKR